MYTIILNVIDNQEEKVVCHIETQTLESLEENLHKAEQAIRANEMSKSEEIMSPKDEPTFYESDRDGNRSEIDREENTQEPR